MKDYRKCNKFVAFVDKECKEETGEYGFYIVDIDSWNKEQIVCPKAKYLNEIYEAIESLGHGCKMDRENHFIVNEQILDRQQLNEFLLPLHWIVAIDELEDTFVEEINLDSFVGEKASIMDIVNGFGGKKIVDEVLSMFAKDEYKKYYASDFNMAYNNFYEYSVRKCIPAAAFKQGDEEKCKVWLEGNKKSTLFCISYDENKVHVYAFDNEKTIEKLKKQSKSYQKLAKKFAEIKDEQEKEALLDEGEGYLE